MTESMALMAETLLFTLEDYWPVLPAAMNLHCISPEPDFEADRRGSISQAAPSGPDRHRMFIPLNQSA